MARKRTDTMQPTRKKGKATPGVEEFKQNRPKLNVGQEASTHAQQKFTNNKKKRG